MTVKSAESKKILALYKNISPVDKLHIYIRLRRIPFDFVEKFVPKKGKILDFGCGHGFFSLYVSQKSKDRVIIGVDISKEKIKTAASSKHSSKVSFKYSLDTISYLSKKLYYNCIVALNVLYLLKRKDQQDMLKRASNALAYGGKLLIIEPDASLKFRTFYEIIRESIMLSLLKRTKGSSLTYNTRAWWMKNLNKYFKKVECIKLRNKKHHVLFVCTK